MRRTAGSARVSRLSFHFLWSCFKSKYFFYEFWECTNNSNYMFSTTKWSSLYFSSYSYWMILRIAQDTSLLISFFNFDKTEIWFLKFLDHAGNLRYKWVATNLWKIQSQSFIIIHKYPTSIYLFKVNRGKARIMCEICSKLQSYNNRCHTLFWCFQY